MTGPSIDNQTADILNTVVSAFMSGGEVAAEAALTALDPALLANPIVAWLMDEAISYLGQILSIAGQKFVDGVVIDIQTNQEKSDVLNTATALALAQASGDPQAISQAVQAASLAWKAAINFDGWANPS